MEEVYSVCKFIVLDMKGSGQIILEIKLRYFPGGPGVKTPHFQCSQCRFDL